jgi:uncharacterized membrane protein YuzA (DUF378 family)
MRAAIDATGFAALMMAAILAGVPAFAYLPWTAEMAFNELLDYSPIAKCAGMAQAVSSLPGDYSAIVFNPATLGFAESFELQTTLAGRSSGSYFDRILYSLTGICPVTERTAFGAQLAYSAKSERYSGIPTGYSFVGRASCGFRLRPDLSLGASAEIAHDAIRLWSPWFGYAELTRGTGWGIDASVLYRTPLPTVNVGLSILNLGPDVDYSRGEHCDRYETIRIGASGRPVSTGKHQVVLSSDLAIARELKDFQDQEKMFRFGTEYNHKEFFYVRAGYWRESGYENGFSGGGGLRVADWISVDVSLSMPDTEYELGSEAFLTVTLTPQRSDTPQDEPSPR